jgi:hypothetical protein
LFYDNYCKQIRKQQVKTMKTDNSHMQNIVKYSRWGELATTIASGLVVMFLAGVAGSILLGKPFPTSDIISELDLEDAADTLTIPQAAGGAACLFFAEFLGLMMIWTARKMFIGFRKGGVFTPQAAAQLRRVGLLILALAPLSILSETLGNFILTLWVTGDRISINLGFNDTDVYAIVIGLVITAVSQIMLEAVRISDENNAFV